PFVADDLAVVVRRRSGVDDESAAFIHGTSWIDGDVKGYVGNIAGNQNIVALIGTQPWIFSGALVAVARGYDFIIWSRKNNRVRGAKLIDICATVTKRQVQLPIGEQACHGKPVRDS